MLELIAGIGVLTMSISLLTISKRLADIADAIRQNGVNR